jgi:indole-3-glycerol phosphate synthase
MMNILEKIVLEKRKQVREEKLLYPVELLRRSIYFETECVSLRKYLLRTDKNGIIAEIKKQSPALGPINPHIKVEKLSIGYMQAGASALSVLTDKKFFGGSNADLTTARKFNFCPILRKDFVIDEYQVIQAKSIGADAILLIAAILSSDEIARFTALAHTLGMEVILDLHDTLEIAKINNDIDVIGVNNRNLGTMKIDINTSKTMARLLPAGMIKISESGIEDPAVLTELRETGYNGFLIGSYFMKHPEPEKACAEFIQQVNKLKKGTDGT